METVMLFMIVIAVLVIAFSLWTTYREKKEFGL